MKTAINSPAGTSGKFTREITCLSTGTNSRRAHVGRQTIAKRVKIKLHKVTGVRHLPEKGGPAMRNGHIDRMGKPSPGRIVEGVVCRVEEHCRVQQQIERRANELWCAGGCRHGTALNDWLQAEREVVEQFIQVCLLA